MEFLPKEIEAYAAQFSENENALLTALVRETNLKTTMPRMLSGHLQGRLLIVFWKSERLRDTLRYAWRKD
jgi:caffeoyl-CoA O-methyltransferase